LCILSLGWSYRYFHSLCIASTKSSVHI
jgi:hypothetical protein